MRRYIILAAALLACAALGAQNLNPTVEVTNDFQGKPMEVEKQNVQMAVPDSLLKFDWNFNYSVFDNPYKGAYEFSPYRIEMKPDATVRDNRMFFLRAGAGYSLHPEAQMVFTPDIKGKFGISLYDDFKGYFGKYHNMAYQVPEDAEGNVCSIVRDGDYGGNEFSNRVGTTLRFDARRAVLTLDAGMDLLKTTEQHTSGNDMLGGSATFRARSIGDSGLLYDISAGWTGLGNKQMYGEAYERRFTEHDAGFDARFVYRLAENHSLRLEPSWHHVIFEQVTEPEEYYTNGILGGVVYSYPLPGKVSADAVDIAPSYAFSDEGFSFMAGIRYSNVWIDNPYFNLAGNRRKLFPDIHLYYEAIPDKLVMTAKVTGGQKYNTYGSYLKENHHFSEYSSAEYSATLADATINTFDAGVGMSASIGSRFQFGADAGYARYLNAPVDRIMEFYSGDDAVGPVSGTGFFYLPFLSMADYDLLYADLTGSYNSDRLEGSARMRVQHTEFKSGGDAFPLPLFTGSAALTYNWNRRLFFGVSAEWATPRIGKGLQPLTYIALPTCTVPGWVDLGVDAEFRVNKRFSLWAEGRNLLNHTVMRDFLIAAKGPYFTAGICLNL